MTNTYAVGDIHGCYATFLRLLARIQFNPLKDKLWLVGDLVNRGPESAAVVRWAMKHDDCVTAVLGNHDLSLLATRALAKEAKESKEPQPRNNALADILNANDADELCAWLRQQPLAHHEHGWLLIHAGVLPMWTLADVLQLAAEAETIIRGEKWHAFATQLYGNRPAAWSNTISGNDRIRLIINALTRLRVCTATGTMQLGFTGGLDALPSGYLPWFDLSERRTADTPIVCGHWSSLGVMCRNNVWAIDSGCSRGAYLTALRLSDCKVFQEPATV